MALEAIVDIESMPPKSDDDDTIEKENSLKKDATTLIELMKDCAHR